MSNCLSFWISYSASSWSFVHWNSPIRFRLRPIQKPSFSEVVSFFGCSGSFLGKVQTASASCLATVSSCCEWTNLFGCSSTSSSNWSCWKFSPMPIIVVEKVRLCSWNRGLCYFKFLKFVSLSGQNVNLHHLIKVHSIFWIVSKTKHNFQTLPLLLIDLGVERIPPHDSRQNRQLLE